VQGCAVMYGVVRCIDPGMTTLVHLPRRSRAESRLRIAGPARPPAIRLRCGALGVAGVRGQASRSDLGHDYLYWVVNPMPRVRH
jgi:hypothetical protein